ncbi:MULTISPECIES: alpha/beta hydrolase [unclassified Paracoccus (in: a-proteobacteria)]|uniref:alpha/beta hydrolase n=1 Tax=unclassified Paracoccus (in: a-proteobacteria) TaxID=2688777 RepID=UPI0015FF7D9E|nr:MULTISPECIES: alpha/beta hydrolase [unclassified Paracoccus (in: a-proteobacteria)]MBB1491531.1 alpha/beta fold hydrolase [Paracoccus sp. MC1854]MBB1497584.1 alpha/beta fold hydrolase [Paracoccus sp. MC1862]QQO44033.1 alpha/beta fold hydrolase [Paracoccus sp. MC1862]
MIVDGIADWDDAYANIAHIPGGAEIPDRWLRDAAAFRAMHPPEAGEAGEFYRPEGPPKGLMVFVHGGYWVKFGPGWFSHFSQGALARGWAVVLPGYPLAPAGTLAEMRDAVAAQVAMAAERIKGPIALAGHSAGGHLAARLICRDSPLPAPVLARIRRCLTISGLFDLRPLQFTAMQGDLGLTDEVAHSESPLFHLPARDLDLHVWVGADERPVFVQQSRLIHAAWAGIPNRTELMVEAGRHHLDVIDGLTDPAHPLTEALLGGL